MAYSPAYTDVTIWRISSVNEIVSPAISVNASIAPRSCRMHNPHFGYMSYFFPYGNDFIY